MHNLTDAHELPPDRPWLPKEQLNMTIILLPLVIQNNKLHSSIRGLALHLMQVPYCNIGYFFKSLDDKDVAYLLHRYKTSEQEQINPSKDETFPAVQEMTLLTFLLGRAEGQTDLTPEYLKVALSSLGTLIRVEDMVRSGKLKVNRLNYSLTDINKPVVLNKTVVELMQIFRDQE